MIHFLMYFIEKNAFLRKRLVYFVHHVKTRLLNCFWLGQTLLVWECFFTIEAERVGKTVVPYFSRIGMCVLVGTTTWILKTLFVDFIGSVFYILKFFDRVQDSLFNDYIIRSLSGPMVEIQPTVEDGENLNLLFQLKMMDASAQQMEDMLHRVSLGLRVCFHEQFLRITNEEDAKTAAHMIFSNISQSGSQYIYFKELRRYIGDTKVLNKLSHIFGIDGFSEEALKSWLVSVFIECRAVVLSLEDTQTALNKLSQISSAVVGAVTCMIFLFILEVATVNMLKFLSGVLVLTSFIFGGVCKTTFEDLVFFFVIRPFDVGDRVEINGVQITVERMKILTTEFLRNDNKKVIYLNSMLSATSVLDCRDAPDIEVIDFFVHKSTLIEKAAEMKDEVASYVKSCPHWQAIPKLTVKDVLDQNQLGFSLYVSHSVLYQGDFEKSKKRDLLIETMRRIFTRLGINYTISTINIKATDFRPFISDRIPLTWTLVKEDE